MGFSRVSGGGGSAPDMPRYKVCSGGGCSPRRAAQRGYVVCARSRMAMRSLSASMQQPHRKTEMAVAVNTPL